MTVNTLSDKIFTENKEVFNMNNITTYQNLDLKSGDKIHFIGIGGISMSGLAEIAMSLNFVVSGSDTRSTEHTERLAKSGAKIFYSQLADNITQTQPDLVVYSSAIPENNEELISANNLGIQSVTRAQFLGWLNRRYETVINISGTHGKSTTTSMAALIMMEAGLDPTVHLGADFEYFGGRTIRIGNEKLFISEADEYKRSFWNFFSTTSIILNIDADHLDVYKDIDDIVDSFVRFAGNLAQNGILIIPADGSHKDDFLKKLKILRDQEQTGDLNIYTFGKYNSELSKNEQADYYYDELEYINGIPHFKVYKNSEFYGDFKLKIPGDHNVSNAIAAIAACDLNGATAEAAQRALEKFHGAGGRYDIFGTFEGAKVIADYAHHPTELRATLQAANSMPHNKIWPICQVLNYSRARDYHEDYLDIFKGYEDVVYYKIYSTREWDDLGESVERFAEEFNSRYDNNAVGLNTVDELINFYHGKVQEGDLILFLGPDGVRDAAIDVCRSENGIYFKDQK